MRRLKRSGSSGFTLIEILLVISLMVIMLGMVAPNFVSVTGGDSSEVTRRLQQVLRLASEEAQLTGMPVRLTVRRSDYSLEKLGGESQWLPMDESPFNAYQLPSGIAILSLDYAGGTPPESRLPVAAPGADSTDNVKEKAVEGVLGRVVLWPDGMVDAADLVVGNEDGSGVNQTIELRSGPGGIRLKEEAAG